MLRLVTPFNFNLARHGLVTPTPTPPRCYFTLSPSSLLLCHPARLHPTSVTLYWSVPGIPIFATSRRSLLPTTAIQSLPTRSQPEDEAASRCRGVCSCCSCCTSGCVSTHPSLPLYPLEWNKDPLGLATPHQRVPNTSGHESWIRHITHSAAFEPS